MSTWDIDLVLMVRVLIGDFLSPQKNTDTYLQSVLVAAGILVNNEIVLPNAYIFDISPNRLLLQLLLQEVVETAKLQLNSLLKWRILPLMEQ